MNYLELMKMTDDMKYLQRLNFVEFARLLHSYEERLDYLEVKWDLFQKDLIQYLWLADTKKFRVITHFIDACKNRTDTNPDIILAAVAEEMNNMNKGE